MTVSIKSTGAWTSKNHHFPGPGHLGGGAVSERFDLRAADEARTMDAD
jgi:hypothetical protein